MYPDIDLYPHILLTSQREPYPAQQTLVLQIGNLGERPLCLRNDTGQSSFAFLPLSQAVPIEGLTMLYLVFPLGEEKGDLTTIDCFRKITLSLPDGLLAQRVGEDTVVIYPSSTLTLEQTDLLEILLGNVVTMGDPGEMVLIRLVLFEDGARISLGFRALYRKTPPFSIAAFSLARECQVSAFRDRLTFSYAVSGGGQSILIPGDEVLSSSYRPGGEIPCVDVLAYRPTTYGIWAFRDGEMAAADLEYLPRKASIRAFQGSYTDNPDGTRDVRLSITVDDTRHAYLNRLGRIPVTPGKEVCVELKKQKPGLSYTLCVENEDGLLRRTVKC